MLASGSWRESEEVVVAGKWMPRIGIMGGLGSLGRTGLGFDPGCQEVWRTRLLTRSKNREGRGLAGSTTFKSAEL